MLSHSDNYSFAAIDELYLYGLNSKVGMHQSYRNETGYGLGGIDEEKYMKVDVLQQPIPSHNDYRGNTC